VVLRGTSFGSLQEFYRKKSRPGVTDYVLAAGFDRIIPSLVRNYFFFTVITMAFDFSCPECRHTMEVDNSAAGEMGVCPKCEAEVLIQRVTAGSAAEEPQTQPGEELSPASPASVSSGDVELGSGTTIATRIVMVGVFLCIMSGGGYLIYNGFEVLGFQYDGFVGLMEDKRDTGLTDYQKRMLEQTRQNPGPPDYSHLAVDVPPPTEEELQFEQYLDANGDMSHGGSFDPEEIFTERDKNMDGLLLGDEISDRWESMDTDKDGAISKEEFLAVMQRFRSSRQGGRGDGAPREGGDAERPGFTGDQR
jgi:hypothetical protein